MSKVRVDTIATHDDSVEFGVAEIALLRDEVNTFNDAIDSINSDINSLDAATVKSSATTGAAAIPVGTEAQRPGAPANGMFRYNSEKNQFEGYQNGKWGQVGGGDPLFSVMWWPQRSAVPAGYVAADGQSLSRATYPDAWVGIQAGNVPTVAEATWQSTNTERGKFTVGNGTSTFRLPDYNGKFAGSLGAVFMRGDGALSAAIAGEIQRDALQNITGNFSADAISIGVGNSDADGAFLTTAQTGFNVQSGTSGNVIDRISFDASRVARTATETRPLNVTGCWVIKLFGAVVNVGSADAAQLASDYANLAAALSSLNSQIDFTIIYPNGGSVGSPANVAVNSRYVLTNPFPGHAVICEAEIQVGGSWGCTGWIYAGNLGYGVVAAMLDGSVIVQTGNGTNLTGASAAHGNPFGGALNPTSAPCRVKVWKVKGAVA